MASINPWMLRGFARRTMVSCQIAFACSALTDTQAWAHQHQRSLFSLHRSHLSTRGRGHRRPQSELKAMPVVVQQTTQQAASIQRRRPGDSCSVASLSEHGAVATIKAARLHGARASDTQPNSQVRSAGWGGAGTRPTLIRAHDLFRSAFVVHL